jgi:hypothetical protein
MVREEHGTYWFSVSPRLQSARALAWEWRIYNRSSGMDAAIGYALSEAEAKRAARAD